MYNKRLSVIGYQLSVGLLFVLLVCSCDKSRVYEVNHDLDSKNWFIDSLETFTFPIKDASKSYNLLINLRNSESYPYYNLFLRYYLTDSLGKELKSQQLELILMNPKTGQPEGKGLGDIFNHQFSLLNDFNFPKTGTYTLKLKQYMRQDPLPEVYSVGLRVEEASPSERK